MNSSEIINDLKIIELATIVNWRGPLEDLIIRIYTLHNNQEFSVREFQTFKRKTRQALKANMLDYVELQLEFPGKTLETIKGLVRANFDGKLKALPH